MNSGMSTQGYRRDVTDRLLVLEEGADRIEESQRSTNERLDQLFRRLDEVVKDLNQRGKLNWPLVVAFLGTMIAASGVAVTILVASLSVFWFLINSQMTNVVNPVHSEMATLTTQVKMNTDGLSLIIPKMSEVVVQNARSEQDRKDLNEATNRARDKVASMDAKISAIDNKLMEVETQFSKSDDSRNIQWSEQQRWNGKVDDTLNSIKAPYPPSPKGPWHQPRTTKDGVQ